MSTRPDIIYLNTLLCCLLMQDYLDKLEKTSYYKRKLHLKAIDFSVVLKKIIEEDVPMVLGIQDEEFAEVYDAFESLIHDLSTLETDFIAITAAFVERLRREPEKVMAALEFKFTDNPSDKNG